MAYITEGDLENFILQDIDVTFGTWITSVISMVEAYVDQYCGTTFANTTAGTNYYDGTGNNELVVGPYSAITALTLLDVNGNDLATLVENTDWAGYPLNSTIKDRIKLLEGGQYGAFPEGTRNVKIAGTFGHNAVPGPVKLAAIQLAAKVINNGLRGGQVSSETLGSYRIDYREVDEVSESLGVKDILNQYRVLTLGDV
jgi:hypothetical protein